MIADSLKAVLSTIPHGVKLVAVSKFHPVEEILQAYNAGQRLFGENRPQELFAKVPQLPSDIQWHFIGHLQTNKLKLVLPYAYVVESVDSEHLLEDIDRWGRANDRVVRVLLEDHIASEETKHGFSEDEILSILSRRADFPSIEFCGLMGMATNTPDESVVRRDFGSIAAFMKRIKDLHPELTSFTELSIGMSGDYKIALEYGATIVRIGTAIFGPREY